MNFFRDKTAIITGAGSGIGKALAEELARRGAHVSICDVNSDRIEKVAEGIRKSGGKVTAFVVNVADYDAVKKMIEDTVAARGKLDLIFNNAGIGIGGSAQDLTIDDWRAVIDIDLYGVVYGAVTAYSIMVKQGFGHIINTASIEGLAPFPGTSSYATSKFGVVGLSTSLRVEGAELGVKVSVVCPGYIKTAIFNDSKLVNVNREKMLADLPAWAGITPDECAKVILRGVECNKAFIVVTLFAKILWALNRISPNLVIWLMQKAYAKVKKDGVVY